MVRLLRFCCLVVCLIFIDGCFRARFEAPYGRNVRMLAEGERGTHIDTHKVWYAFWGLLPLTPTQTDIAKYYAQMPIEAMRVEVKIDTMDALITFFTRLLGLFNLTIEVEYILAPEKKRVPARW